VDETDRLVGVVTSFSFLTPEFDFVALACVEEGFDPQPGSLVRGVRVADAQYEPPAAEKAVVTLRVMPRFPDEDERADWTETYL
jgi:hypothetical protein